MTIGILPGLLHDEANPFIDVVLPSGLGIVRNSLIASSCDFLIALPGGTGTLEEICFALDYKKAVLSVESWSIPEVNFLEKFNSEDVLKRIEQMMEKNESK